jgi:lipoprotein-releasing system permease protein
MNFSSIIATRYLASGRRDRFFSSIAVLSILGVAIGLATMIVVLSVINGFETELRERFLNANSHVLLFRYPDGLANPIDWQKKVEKEFKDDVIGTSPFVHYETMARKGGLMHSVLIRGFNPAQREKVQSVRSWVDPQDSLDLLSKESAKPLPAEPSIIVGEGILGILNVKVGDSIDLISPNSQDFKRLRRFKIVGIYHSGLKHYDNRLIAMSLLAAQSFFGMGQRVTGIEVGLKKPYDSPDVAKRMSEKLPLSIKEWQSFNRPLLEALNMERAVIFIVVCLVAIVAGFNILTTLFVAVTQKQRDISIMKAIGANNMQIVKIFLKQGFLFGLIGSILGVLIALSVSWIIQSYQFIELPDPYYVTRLPVDYDWRVYAVLSAFSILICIIAGLFPAWAATMVTPTTGIKGNAKTSS